MRVRPTEIDGSGYLSWDAFPDNSLLIPCSGESDPMKMRVRALPEITGKKFPDIFPDNSLSCEDEGIIRES